MVSSHLYFLNCTVCFFNFVKIWENQKLTSLHLLIVLTIKIYWKFVNSAILNCIFSVKIFYRSHPSIIARNSWIWRYSVEQNITFGKKNLFQFQFNNHNWEQSKLKNGWYYTKLNCRSFSRHHVKFMPHEKKNRSTRINLRTKTVKDLIFVIGPKSFCSKKVQAWTTQLKFHWRKTWVPILALGPFIYYVSTFLGFLPPPLPLHKVIFSCL